MNNEVEQYIKAQPERFQNLLTTIHSIILEEDSSLEVNVGDFEMDEKRNFVDAIGYRKLIVHINLICRNNHVELYVLPFGCYPEMITKYKTLFPNAAFKEHSIVFTSEEDLPVEALRQLVSECSTFDVGKWQREEWERRAAMNN